MTTSEDVTDEERLAMAREIGIPQWLPTEPGTYAGAVGKAIDAAVRYKRERDASDAAKREWERLCNEANRLWRAAADRAEQAERDLRDITASKEAILEKLYDERDALREALEDVDPRCSCGLWSGLHHADNCSVVIRDRALAATATKGRDDHE